MANKWLDANMEALEENFAYIGIDDAHKFVNEAADEYHLYCSGRQNCESMTVVVKTAPRHCAFTMIYQLLTSKMTEDTVTFEVRASCCDFALRQVCFSPVFPPKSCVLAAATLP